MAAMKHVQVPCSSCVRITTHRVLHEVAHRYKDRIENYAMLECAGCQTISMGRQTIHIPNGEVDNTYYPSPVSRKKPTWVPLLQLGLIGAKGEYEYNLGDLLNEIYEALDGGQHRLTAMGIRALLEQVMIAKVGDRKTFEEKLDEFQTQGYISLLQRDAMRETLEIGHAAMHRSFKPNERELTVALDIVEGIFAPIFDHTDAAANLSERVPQRSSTLKPKPTPAARRQRPSQP